MPRTAFTLVSDAAYLPRALRTIEDLRTRGQWTGDVILLAVGVEPAPEVLERWGVTCRPVSPVDVSALQAAWAVHPIRRMADDRHAKKLAQWNKLHVFDPWFRRWERVVYLDAGLRVVNAVEPLLALPWDGALLAPDDALPGDNGKRFRCQLDLEADPAVTQRLLGDFSPTILDARYFLNCLWVYDTALLERVDAQALVASMNRYPISLTNEMAIMNLTFTFRLGVWRPLPEVAPGTGRHLFGWSELNYPDERPTWRDFHFLKYPVTLAADEFWSGG